MINYIVGCFILVFTLLSGMLMMQYRTFRDEVQRLVEVRQEYRTYNLTFRKIMRDYQRLKEGYETEDEASADVEKKKETPFLVVNREPDYLKSSMLRYMKQRRLKRVMYRLQATGQLTIGADPRDEKKPPIKKRSRRRTSVSYPLVEAQLNYIRQRNHLQRKAAYADLNLMWPIERSSFWLSSFFGPRRKPNRTWGFHYGIDMAAIKGTPIMAAESGVVVESGPNKGFGNTVVIMHNDKYRTRYAHLHRIYVRTGKHVARGERIGTVGDTGLVRKRGRSAAHLHLEVTAYGKRVNPLFFFS